ncbi:MAG: aminotransferase class III-fold pyridoxal phosphate-dependent enzyme [Chlamydiia bacterium]|nr:aminotransferase class III-fold pyridoxal phosphate-dependent enzyme [Chlamydiia bacterium]
MRELAAESLSRDPRLDRAKRLLTAALTEQSETLAGVRPPDPERALAYRELLDEFGKMRGGALFYPFLGSGIGNGALVELLDGSVKYDFITGIGVHGFGHSHPEVTAVLVDAALSDTIMEGHLQQNLDAVELSKLLIDASGLDCCFLSSTGVMANENGLKIAFQAGFPKTRLLAFEKCFMGRTLTVSQITDKPAFRAGLPLNQPVDYIPFFDEKDPEGSTKRAVQALRQTLDRYPCQHAAMCFELIQGEGGFRVGSKEFFRTLMTLLKERGILILADEVQSFGRTSHLFAYQYFELDDLVDIVTIGKISQACATLFRKELIPKPGLLAQTFTTSTGAIKASRWVVEKFQKGGYLGQEGRNMQIHARFSEHLNRIKEKHPQLIDGPWGIGGMVAFTPYGGDAARAQDFAKKLFEAGVMCFTAGQNPTRIRFLPPVLVIKDHEIDEACKILEETLISCA